MLIPLMLRKLLCLLLRLLLPQLPLLPLLPVLLHLKCMLLLGSLLCHLLPIAAHACTSHFRHCRWSLWRHDACGGRAH
jgi:hypothetical protein